MKSLKTITTPACYFKVAAYNLLIWGARVCVNVPAEAEILIHLPNPYFQFVSVPVSSHPVFDLEW